MWGESGPDGPFLQESGFSKNLNFFKRPFGGFNVGEEE